MMAKVSWMMETCQIEMIVAYALQNTPFEDLDTQNRKFIFRQGIEVLGIDEDIQEVTANIEGETTCGRDEK